jgi:phosphatidylinositol alpha-1,6-mannosyltransferase
MLANVFPPISGGSAAVYEGLCQFCPRGSIHVLAPWRHYLTGTEIENWRQYDAAAGFPITRIELVRPPITAARSLLHSLWLHLTVDIPIKRRVLSAAIKLAFQQRVGVTCICELHSGTWLGLMLRHLLGIPFIVYIHGEEITVDSLCLRYGQRRLEFLQRADALVAVSKFTRNQLIDRFGIAPDKVQLITNGVDADFFHPGDKDPRLLSRYGLNGKRVLLTVGRLVARKGFDMTVRSMPSILKQVPNAHYLIVGAGELEPQLRAMVSDLKLCDHVTFAGRVAADELVTHYQLCDLFIMPNREMDDRETEGFGLVFLEASACGKAVIGGRDGGAVEAIRDGVTGLTVDGRYPAAIAAAVIELLTNDARRHAMEQAGLEFARQSSSAERAREFEALCDHVAKTRRPHWW